jgi:hypothetical protein
MARCREGAWQAVSRRRTLGRVSVPRVAARSRWSGRPAAPAPPPPARGRRRPPRMARAARCVAWRTRDTPCGSAAPRGHTSPSGLHDRRCTARSTSTWRGRPRLETTSHPRPCSRRACARSRRRSSLRAVRLEARAGARRAAPARGRARGGTAPGAIGRARRRGFSREAARWRPPPCRQRERALGGGRGWRVVRGTGRGGGRGGGRHTPLSPLRRLHAIELGHEALGCAVVEAIQQLPLLRVLLGIDAERVRLPVSLARGGVGRVRDHSVAEAVRIKVLKCGQQRIDEAVTWQAWPDEARLEHRLRLIPIARASSATRRHVRDVVVDRARIVILHGANQVATSRFLRSRSSCRSVHACTHGRGGTRGPAEPRWVRQKLSPIRGASASGRHCDQRISRRIMHTNTIPASRTAHRPLIKVTKSGAQTRRPDS